MSINTVINTNVMALTAHRNLSKVGINQSKANNRLASGKKINTAADDAAGLAISDKMKSQIRGLDMASKNAEDATSLIQTAEGSLSEVTNMIQRIRELTVQAANDTNTQDDRKKINAEVQQLKTEINEIAQRTEFNKRKLTTGAFSASSTNLFFQVGANSGQSLKLNIGAMDATSLGVADITSRFSALANSASGAGAGTAFSDLIGGLDTALSTIATQRANLGANQNRLEYTINNLNVSSENLSAANSRIEDADMAKEMMRLTSANVLQQAATSMLAQANQAPNNITQLLG